MGSGPSRTFGLPWQLAMVSQPIPIHIFRARLFAKSEAVVTKGLEAAFGVSAYYRDEATEEAYLAVWGARNG